MRLPSRSGCTAANRNRSWPNRQGSGHLRLVSFLAQLRPVRRQDDKPSIRLPSRKKKPKKQRGALACKRWSRAALFLPHSVPDQLSKPPRGVLTVIYRRFLFERDALIRSYFHRTVYNNSLGPLILIVVSFLFLLFYVPRFGPA